jgi:hypothetical protein
VWEHVRVAKNVRGMGRWRFSSEGEPVSQGCAWQKSCSFEGDAIGLPIQTRDGARRSCHPGLCSTHENLQRAITHSFRCCSHPRRHISHPSPYSPRAAVVQVPPVTGDVPAVTGTPDEAGRARAGPFKARAGPINFLRGERIPEPTRRPLSASTPGRTNGRNRSSNPFRAPKSPLDSLNRSKHSGVNLPARALLAPCSRDSPRSRDALLAPARAPCSRPARADSPLLAHCSRPARACPAYP